VTSYVLFAIRAIMHMREGKAGLVFAVSKLTVSDNAFDSSFAARADNLVAAVDFASGELPQAWGSANRKGPVTTPYSNHPDSAAPIKGTVLPFSKELAERVRAAQSNLPSMQPLGRDIGDTAEGMVLVEAKEVYDLSIPQIAHQRGLKRELEASLGEAA
jgi:hypothetical protein